jgi:thioredoxin-dependent peroxiredoxin
MKLKLAFVLCLAGLAVSVWAASNSRTAAALQIGDPLPDVGSEDQDGKPVNLAELGKGGYLLVYFYPKAFTPGCTAQACSLRDAYSQLQSKGVRVVGVSLDSVDSQKKFQEKEHLPFELLSDHERKVTRAFGVPLMVNSFATRQAYLFKDGKLIWKDAKASTDRQAQDVLAVLEQQSE